MKSISLPYNLDITPIFNTIASYPWSILLDSGQNPELNQRFDIISGFPNKVITSDLSYCIIKTLEYDVRLNIINNNFQRFSNKNKNIFDCINNEISELQVCFDKQFKDTPFWNGIIGYLGYDLNQIICSKLNKFESQHDIPIGAVGVYPWALITDHKLKECKLVYDESNISKLRISIILEKLSSSNNTEKLLKNNHKKSHALNKFLSENKFASNISKESYQNNFKKIKRHINDGDCYQINYTIPFKIETHSQPFTSWEVYQHCKKFNKNPFGCYYNLPNNHAILSFSPERFIKLENNQVITQPIKGTSKRDLNNQALDAKAAIELSNSKKDRAENIMIADLLRNDLHRYCKPGSVKTEKICELTSFPTVHHLVTTITAELDEKYSSIELLKGCFPGGSITGAPKIRAMQIIQDLENTNNSISRYAYCGSIGYINCNGNMDMNIAIRTMVLLESTYHYWAGGGLVADSECEQEYQEVMAKLIKTFEK